MSAQASRRAIAQQSDDEIPVRSGSSVASGRVLAVVRPSDPVAMKTETTTLTAQAVAVAPSNACGGPSLIVQEGGMVGMTFRVPAGGRLIVGRDPSCDIRLAVRSVSRRHAVVERANGDIVTIRDLESRNGIAVDGVVVQGTTQLADGATIRLGDASLRFFGHESAHAELHSRMFDLATRDPLTGLYNRRFFEESFERLLIEAARRQSQLAVALLDLDHFKSINDAYGHDVGDRVLRSVASELASGARASDLVVRWGGEEFAVLLPDASVDVACAVMNRIRKRLQRIQSDAVPAVTMSVGVAGTLPLRGTSVSLQARELLKRADRALFRAKLDGRNRIASG